MRGRSVDKNLINWTQIGTFRKGIPSKFYQQYYIRFYLNLNAIILHKYHIFYKGLDGSEIPGSPCFITSIFKSCTHKLNNLCTRIIKITLLYFLYERCSYPPLNGKQIWNVTRNPLIIQSWLTKQKRFNNGIMPISGHIRQTGNKSSLSEQKTHLLGKWRGDFQFLKTYFLSTPVVKYFMRRSVEWLRGAACKEVFTPLWLMRGYFPSCCPSPML